MHVGLRVLLVSGAHLLPVFIAARVKVSAVGSLSSCQYFLESEVFDVVLVVSDGSDTFVRAILDLACFHQPAVNRLIVASYETPALSSCVAEGLAAGIVMPPVEPVDVLELLAVVDVGPPRDALT